MERLAGWEQALVDWLAACEREPFVWGQHDCCSFAAGAVKAQTGVDHYAPFAGGYRTAAGALKALKRQGFEDLHGPFDAALGERTAPLLLQRGDIVSDGARIGVIWYRAGPCALFVGGEAADEGAEIGLIARPLREMAFGWRVAAHG